MTKKLIKGTSLLLAIIICVSTFIGIGSTTAFAAAGEKTEVYLIDYPRDGDSNYYDDWGHREMKYMNGWKDFETSCTGLRVIGSYFGNIAYCIEPGTAQDIGDTLTEKNENYFDNYASKFNKTISGDDVKIFIGRILQYGYQGGISSEWYSQNKEDANCMAHAMATQFLIWETVVGERDEYFNHVSTGKYDAILDSMSSSHPLRSKVMSYYNSMVSSVQKHTTVPSFCTRSTGSAKTVELEWDGSKYVTTLTDTNKVLSNYSFKADVSDVRIEKDGNKLNISMNKAPDKAVTITASKNNAVRKGVVVWTDGKLEVGNGIQDVVSYAQEVSDPVKGFLKLTVSYGSCEIVKTSEDGKVDGISFTVSGNGVNKTVTTDKNGKILIDNLMPGVYTVTEQTYDKYEPQKSQKVTVVAGQTATVNFNNVLKRGDLKVVKSAEDNFVEGVTFRLYGTSLAGVKVDEYAKTDKTGVATFKDVPISGNTPYTLEEIDTEARYLVPAKQTAPIVWNEVTNRSFNNILKKFTVTVTKSDSEKGIAQGNATLAGAVYGIFKGDTLIDEYVTDENGQFTTKEYTCGDDWTIKEITPSEGYLLDTAVHKVGAESKLYKIEHNLISMDVTEEVIKGNISIIKHTDNGDTQIETPESGATFEIYLKSAGSYKKANEYERDIIVCDENGFGKTKDMPYGVYTVHQTKSWDGREKIKDFDVFISQDSETYRYIINNRNFESFLKVVKVDADSGKNIPYAGAGFKIIDPSGNQVTMSVTYPTPETIDVFYTDSNGSLVTPESLEYGKGYQLVEVKAPYGYILDETPVSFDITEDNSTEENGVTVVKVTKENKAQKGTITIEKTGEIFIDVNVSGDDSANKIYQPVYEITGLEGAVFEIRAAEDIYTPDGTLRCKKGTLVDTLTTTFDGFAKSKELYLGKYVATEIKAPFGTVLSGENHEIELTYAGQNVAVSETATSIYNERQKVEISLEKVFEVNDTFGIGNSDELKKVSFGLYADEDIKSVNGTVIPKDGLIEIVSLDENSKAVMKTDLPFGKYYVKELTTDEHYLLSDTKYSAVFKYEGQGISKAIIEINNGKEIENKLIYGSVSGKKVDENGKGLSGALIGLFKSTDIEFTEENAILTTVSKEDGSFSFENIPYGVWFVREIEQPTGFVLNNTVYEVNISEHKQVVNIEIVNEHIRGNIALTKVDADYPDNKLTGAVFEVYKDTNDNDIIDKSDELIGNLKETSTGFYELNDLFYGKYLVREAKAPDGFLLDEGVYPVFVETNEATYSVENKAGVGFINNAMKGKLKIVKTSSDKKVEGFAFRVTGPDGYDMTFETDKNGIIEINGLRIGEYKVSEVANKTSAVYVLPDDKTATVKNDSTTVVEMHNILRDTPKTGDDSNMNLWYVLATLSALGIGVTGIVLLKKKKKEDKN